MVQKVVILIKHVLTVMFKRFISTLTAEKQLFLNFRIFQKTKNQRQTEGYLVNADHKVTKNLPIYDQLCSGYTLETFWMQIEK